MKLRRGRSMLRVPAVAVQADDERLDQADAAVVPEAGAVADQRLRVVEGGAVSVARHHRQARGLVDGGLRAEGCRTGARSPCRRRCRTGYRPAPTGNRRFYGPASRSEGVRCGRPRQFGRLSLMRSASRKRSAHLGRTATYGRVPMARCGACAGSRLWRVLTNFKADSRVVVSADPLRPVGSCGRRSAPRSRLGTAGLGLAACLFCPQSESMDQLNRGNSVPDQTNVGGRCLHGAFKVR